ncbi:ribbon-helix-helix protein, CopG family [bacterium]|nr:ribbon-helix-helix protein, CopG family [bacterium]
MNKHHRTYKKLQRNRNVRKKVTSISLPPETFAAVDAAKEAAGLSRNMWIAEAVAEKLERGE